MKSITYCFACFIVTLGLLAGCTSAPATSDILEATQPAPAEVQPTEPAPTQPPAATPTEAPTITSEPQTATPVPTEPLGHPPLPPESQVIGFEAADGQALNGAYYPAAINPAPLVVLMHWAGGDQDDWLEISYWLQNRGLGGNTPNPQNLPWLDSSWFPPILEGGSYAVFTFTFRNCEGGNGCQNFDQQGWLLDAQAAMSKARQLEGIDQQRIVAMGASIGADGAPDGCFWVNQQEENTCLGAFSLSPGSYLTVDYAEAVNTLEAEVQPKPVWCLFADGDSESASACNAATGEHYQKTSYTGNAHGMFLLQPGLEPNALQLMLDFLTLSLGR